MNGMGAGGMSNANLGMGSKKPKDMVRAKPDLCEKKDCDGRCCSLFRIKYITEKDIKNLAEFLDITIEEFKKEYITRYGRLKARVYKGEPHCVFYKYRKCSVHDSKPLGCKNWMCNGRQRRELSLNF